MIFIFFGEKVQRYLYISLLVAVICFSMGILVRARSTYEEYLGYLDDPKVTLYVGGCVL